VDKLIDTFITLVKIDSPSGEEAALILYLKNRLSGMGFSIKVDALGQILASTSSDNPLLITAHLDTVEPGRKINPQVFDDVIRSDGTTILGADNKAFIATLLMAIEEYKSLHGILPQIELLFSVKEETGGGIDHFPFEWIKSKKGITFDLAQPLGKITIQAPFIYNFRVTFIGKAAHSSKPEDGINSLICATSFVNNIKMGRIDSETTVNVGKISGGTGINTIPEKSIVEGEVRSANINTFNLLLKEIESQAITTSKSYKVKLMFDLNGYCPGYKYSKNDSFIAKISDLLKSKHHEVHLYESIGVSDANIIANKGIKFLCLSDGVENPHTNSEQISITNLKLLKELILECLNKASDLAASS